MRTHTDVKGRGEAMADGVDAIRGKMRESGLRIEAQHARDVATAERIQRELQEQIKAATTEGERRWEQLKKSVQRVAPEARTVVKNVKEVTP